MENLELYKKMEKLSGIKVGDTVKVLRIAKNREMGWDNTWARDMNQSVGNVYKVINVSPNGMGIQLDDDVQYRYPFFVLEKITEAPNVKVFSFGGHGSNYF